MANNEEMKQLIKDGFEKQEKQMREMVEKLS